MRSFTVFLGESLSLCCPKPMLFIDNDYGKVFKFDRFLNQSMSTDKDSNFTGSNPLEKLGTRNICPSIGVNFGWEFSASASGNKSDIDGQMEKIFYKRFKVLLG